MDQVNPTFSKKLLTWYERNKRDLPWRETKDPYLIWLSEIILQQTRVVQGLPYYQRFASKYPTVTDLAQASQEEVLSLWQGLGYYSRARNLHACAQMVASSHNGSFPSTYDELIKLKGIGAYTAAAIASFAFDEAVPVIDGNVFRVAARVFGITEDIANSTSRKVFDLTLRRLIPHDAPGEFNQAMMEFGALQCTPASPDCGGCIFKSECFAFNHSEVENLPVKSKKTKVAIRNFNYFVFEFENTVLVRPRKSKDIWLGLHDFHAQETTEIFGEEEALCTIADFLGPEKWELIDTSDTYKHILTHRIIYAKFFRVRLAKKGDLDMLMRRFNLISVDADNFESISKPVLISKYLKNYKA